MNYQPQHICPACGSGEATIVSEIDGKSGEPLITVECGACGLGRIDPLPTQDDLRKWYTEQYRQEYKGSFRPKMRHVLRAARLSRSRWLWVAEQMRLNTVARTLDIGASSGEFVYLMQSLGFDAQGLEPHLGYGSHARDALGLKVHQGTLDDAPKYFQAESHDFISMFHVFEHVVNPVETLKQVSALLKPGGYFLLEVPDATKLCAPHTMFFRAHTLYFSRDAIAHLLVFAGFELVNQREHNGNLLLLTRKPVSAAVSALSTDVAYSTRQLVLAQKQRSWPSYLLRELIDLSLFKRLVRQVEERLNAYKHKDYSGLLDKVYSSRPGTGKG